MFIPKEILLNLMLLDISDINKYWFPYFMVPRSPHLFASWKWIHFKRLESSISMIQIFENFKMITIKVLWCERFTATKPLRVSTENIFCTKTFVRFNTSIRLGIGTFPIGNTLFTGFSLITWQTNTFVWTAISTFRAYSIVTAFRPKKKICKKKLIQVSREIFSCG